jgi:hypothetical protein
MLVVVRLHWYKWYIGQEGPHVSALGYAWYQLYHFRRRVPLEHIVQI